MSRRFDVWLVGLDPTIGSEMKKTRPAVIISPDEMNTRLHTVIVAPLTSRGFAAPFRVPCRFENKDGQIALDHLRAVDKARLMRKLGQLDDATANSVLAVLADMFSAYPNQILTVVIWGRDRAKFPDSPEAYYRDRKICVTGRITGYRGKAEIIVEDPLQIAASE